MAQRENPEDDVQAWIDSRLAVARTEPLRAWFEAHPEAAARAERDRLLREELRARLAPRLELPIPPRLRIADIVAKRRHNRRLVLRRLAASVALLAAGGAAGWFANEAARLPAGSRVAGILQELAGRGLPLITTDALAAHRMFVVEQRHPVEVDVREEEHLVRWLSNRLKRPLKAPDLTPEGFQLMGGRLLPGSDNVPAAQLMYVDGNGVRLTVYLRATGDEATTEFRFAQEGDVNAFWWMDRGFGYAISAPVSRDKLLTIAQAVYSELTKAQN